MKRFQWLSRLAVLALLLAFVLACVLVPGPGQADENTREKDTVLSADLKLIPGDTGVFVSVRVAELMSSETGKKLLPVIRKMFDSELGRLEKGLGVSLDNIERLTVLGSPNPEHRGFGGFIVRTVKPYDLKKVIGPGAEKDTVEGKTVYERDPIERIYPVDKNTFVLTEKTRLATVIKAAAGKQKHPLAEALKRAGKHHITLAVQPEALIRALIGQMAEPPAAPAPNDGDTKEARLRFRNREQIAFVRQEKKDPKKKENAEYEDILDEITLDRDMAALLPYRPLFMAKWAVVTADIGKGISVAAEAEFKDADSAKDAETSVRTGLYVTRTFLQRSAKTDLGESVPALLKLEKPLVAGLKAAKVQRDGTKVSASASVDVGAEVLAAVAKAMRDQALMVQAQNHFKQIGLAMHNYHDANGALPAAAICDKKGKPLLSWRVAILPYLEQDNVYKQFKLDEPWDSKHNKALLKHMPTIYAPTIGKTKEPHSTYYRVFTGKDALFPMETNKGRRLVDITDGTSNTIMVVEAAQEVPWTKPDELAFDLQKALPKLGGQFPGKFIVLMGDGSVRMVKTKVDTDTLKAAITHNGGEVIGNLD